MSDFPLKYKPTCVAGDDSDAPLVIRFARLLLGQFGAYLFGLASVLVLWFAIADPAMRRRDAELASALTEMRGAVGALTSSTNRFGETLAALQDINRRLERLAPGDFSAIPLHR